MFRYINSSVLRGASHRAAILSVLLLSLPFVSISAPVRSNLGGDGEEYGDVEPYTAASYVQDGLFCMYDGIENAGWGIHEDTLTQMQDLGPYNLSFPVPASWTVGEDNIFVPKNYYTPRTINLPDDAYEELITALSNATITIEYVWEDLGSDYPTSEGLGVLGPVKVLGSRDALLGCRKNSFRGNFWASGYGYYWGPVIKIEDIQQDGSYSAMLYGLETDYKVKEVIRYNELYSIGTAPNNSSTLHGTWAQRVRHIVPTRQLILVYQNNGYTGRLYNLRIYTRALSLEEIAHNYMVDKARFGL